MKLLKNLSQEAVKFQRVQKSWVKRRLFPSIIKEVPVDWVKMVLEKLHVVKYVVLILCHPVSMVHLGFTNNRNDSQMLTVAQMVELQIVVLMVVSSILIRQPKRI